MTQTTASSTVRAVGGVPTEPVRFHEQASQHLRATQAAITDLLAGIGLGGARPAEVGRLLGVDKTLAWKISRFIDNADPIQAAKHMPGANGVEIFFRAVESKGVQSPRVDDARAADRRLREFVQKQAGDRRSFEAMLGGGGLDEKVEYDERRAYFRAGSAIWGVRARVQFLMLALRPAEPDNGKLDVAQIGGLVDFERLRPDIPWIFRRLHAASDGGSNRYPVEREPLDPAGASDRATALVPEFCSEPMPRVRQFDGDDGMIYDEIAPGPVGREGAVTCVAGEIYRSAVPYRYAEDNQEARYLLSVRTPVEFVRMDLLLHRSLTHWSGAQQGVAGLLEARPSASSMSRFANIDFARAIELGSPPMVHSPKFAEYPEIVVGALERAGWGSVDDFVGYRAECDFPAPPCNLVLRFDIERSFAAGTSMG
ncbi:MAG: hypothetical protein AAGI30_03480 [Planctomycetota bacterium]